MLELPNFGHTTTTTMQFESRDKILLVTSWIKNDVIILFQSNFTFRKI